MTGGLQHCLSHYPAITRSVHFQVHPNSAVHCSGLMQRAKSLIGCFAGKVWVVKRVASEIESIEQANFQGKILDSAADWCGNLDQH